MAFFILPELLIADNQFKVFVPSCWKWKVNILASECTLQVAIGTDGLNFK
jgi:hypothetical protein